MGAATKSETRSLPDRAPSSRIAFSLSFLKILNAYERPKDHADHADHADGAYQKR